MPVRSHERSLSTPKPTTTQEYFRIRLPRFPERP